MNDQAAKELADAINNLAEAIKRVSGPGFMGGGAIRLHHEGAANIGGYAQLRVKLVPPRVA